MLGAFMALTFIFFVAKYNLQIVFKNRNSPPFATMGLFAAYFLLIIFAQIMENDKLVVDSCDKGYTKEIAAATLIPNILIFFLTMGLLLIFPGWKAPFSNTLGYLFAKALNIKGSFDELLIKGETSDSLMKRIIEDKSLIINEISTTNFDMFLKNMDNYGLLAGNYDKLSEIAAGTEQGKKIKDPELNEKAESVTNLWKAVVLKDLVGEVMWYILAGTLVISIIKSNIADMLCVKMEDTDTT